MKFNINRNIRFKLNKAMESEFVHGFCKTYKEIFGEPSEDGYYKSQFWNAMHFLGPYFYMGSDPIIEDCNILIDKKDLESEGDDLQKAAGFTEEQIEGAEVEAESAMLKSALEGCLTKHIELRIDDYSQRNQTALTLMNNGYSVKIEGRGSTGYGRTDYNGNFEMMPEYMVLIADYLEK